MKPKVSVILRARNEFPSVVFTIHSILAAWKADGYDYKDMEIILLDNLSNDDKYPQRGTGGTTSYLEGRGMYYNNILRVVRCPIAGNNAIVNIGAKIARGKLLFISDAHCCYEPGFFKEMIKATEESGGIAHCAVNWMGAYPGDYARNLQYTIKLGEEWKGTWAPYSVSEDWFYIASQGHCALMVDREQFLDFGGYFEQQRCYGSNEFAIDSKWWMFGSSVVVAPRAICYHLASGRNYSYNHNDYVRNIIGVTYAMGCDDWRERFYINCLRKHRKSDMDRMMSETEIEFAKDREFIDKRKVMTFNEMIVQRPWDRKNDERHGSHNSAMTIFHDTIIELFKQHPVAWEAYQNSKYQEGLAKFIDDNLDEFVYKRKRA